MREKAKLLAGERTQEQNVYLKLGQIRAEECQEVVANPQIAPFKGQNGAKKDQGRTNSRALLINELRDCHRPTQCDSRSFFSVVKREDGMHGSAELTL